MSKTLFVSTTLLFLSLSFYSCSTVLKAKFESEALGTLPNKTLPGDPTGDEVTYIPDIENRLEIVNWDGDKALEISNITPTGSPSFASTYTTFISRSSPFSRPVTYSWNGQFNSNFGEHFIISISAGSGISSVMTTLRIEPNGQLFYLTDFVNEVLLGTIDLNQPHTFILTFDKNSRLFGLSVFQSGETISAQELPFREGSGPFPATTRFRISFNFRETQNPPEIDLGHFYLIDELTIAHRNP